MKSVVIRRDFEGKPIWNLENAGRNEQIDNN